MHTLLPQWVRKTIAHNKRQIRGSPAATERGVLLEQLEARRLLAITASISGNSSVNEGSNYTLNLSASGGMPIHWDINWGDGFDPDGNGDGKQRVSGNPTSVTHKYADGDNNYTVRATAYETAGGTGYDSNNKSVAVNDVAPTPGVSGSAFAYKNRPYVLNLIEHDPGQDTVSAWKIDWGDGSPEQTVSGDPDQVSHTYTTTGTRTITARVVNEDGTYPSVWFPLYNRRNVTVQDAQPLDELLVDSRSTSVVRGSAVLKEGVKYKLVASGWGAMDLNNQRSMDAEYYDTQSSTPRDKTNDGIDFGITRVAWNNGALATDWGAYRSDHVYEIEVTGDGRPLALKFVDRAGYYTDNAGVLAVAVFAVQRPFGGVAPQAPGLFEAENFDDGGEGVAYHDNTKGNYYGTQYKRREDADVDIVRDETTGGFEIDHVSAGEWLEYTINVPTAGTYELATRAGAPGTGGVFHWEMDGTDITGPLSVPDTGSHWKYEWVRTNVTLPAGEHVFRLSMDANGQWLDNRSGVGKFDAFAITNPATAPAAPTNLAAPFTFANRIDLTWTDATNNETDYELERGTDGVNFVKVRTLRGNLTSYSDTSLAASTTYHYRLRATNTAGGSGYSNTLSASTPAATPTPYKINFQTDHTPPVLGYKVDSGDVYGPRGDGLSYGWNIDHTLQDRDRGTGIDRKLDTLVGMRDGGTWEIDLPNGTYQVRVSVGDAHWASTNTLNVEGTNYWDALGLAKNQFRQKSLAVQVSDGRLTLDGGTKPKEGARLNYIEITPSGTEPVVTIAASDAEAVEGATPPNEGEFTVTRQGGDQTVDLDVYFSLGGQATFGVDYNLANATPPSGSETRARVTIPANSASTTFRIVPVADGQAETTFNGESVSATLWDEAGYAVGTPAGAAVTIYDAPPPPPSQAVVNIALAPGSPQSIEEGSAELLVFRLTRTGDTANPLPVRFAHPNAQPLGLQDFVYEDPQTSVSAMTFTIPQGASEHLITVRSVDDTLEEGDEQLKIQLMPSTNDSYTIGTQPSATGTIIDNDSLVSEGLTFNVPSTGEIDVSWGAVDNAVGYYVYRDDASFAPTPEQRIAFVEDTYIEDWGLPDVDLLPNTAYHYIVTALYASGAEATVGSGSAVTLASDTELEPVAAAADTGGVVAQQLVPSAHPTNLNAIGINLTSIFLHWDDNSRNETRWVIQRSPDGVNWQTVRTLRGSARTYTDRLLNHNLTYHYRVRAANLFGSSNWTNVANAQPRQPATDHVVYVFGGHLQTQRWLEGGWFRNDRGAGTIWADLWTQGYNVYLSAEHGWGGVVDWNGTGVALDEMNVNIAAGYRDIGLIGYSHGAGTAFNMNQRIEDERPNPPTPSLHTVRYFGVIDGVERGFGDWSPASTAPLTTTMVSNAQVPHIVNYFEVNGTFGIHGSGIIGAQSIQVNTTDAGGSIDHVNIYRQPSVMAGIENGLAQVITAI